MAGRELTNKQKDILNTIIDLFIKNGKIPTYEEVRARLGYKSISSIQVHVNALKKKKYLSSEKGAGLRLTVYSKEVGKKVFSIPLIGEVACGSPDIAVEDIQGYIPYMASNLSGGTSDYFFLKAKGDSMNDQPKINEGDLLLVKRQSSMPNLGEMAVVLIGNEATVKYFRRDNEGVYYLDPSSTNPIHKPIYLIGQDEVLFCGVVKDVLKKDKIKIDE
jgi:repressor LexA